MPELTESPARSGPQVGAARRASVWFGVAIIGCGIVALLVQALGREVFATTGYILMVAGAAEGLAGYSDRRTAHRRWMLDVWLGLVSLTAGAALWVLPDQGALTFLSIIAVWLVTRGIFEVVASFLMPNLYFTEGRVLRASVDLVLGFISWVGVEVMGWLEPFLGRAPSSTNLVLLFAGLSLIATGIVRVGESSRLASEGRREDRP